MSKTRKPSEENNPGPYVTRREFDLTIKPMKKDIRTILTALVGKDMRSGIVKDVADLKKSRSVTLEVVKNVVVPIVVAVVAVLLTSRLPI